MKFMFHVFESITTNLKNLNLKFLVHILRKITITSSVALYICIFPVTLTINRYCSSMQNSVAGLCN